MTECKTEGLTYKEAMQAHLDGVPSENIMDGMGMNAAPGRDQFSGALFYASREPYSIVLPKPKPLDYNEIEKRVLAGNDKFALKITCPGGPKSGFVFYGMHNWFLGDWAKIKHALDRVHANAEGWSVELIESGENN
jgi:hypothetical protein